MTFTGYTQLNNTQDLFESHCEKRRKGVLGPEMGKILAIHIDDLNMSYTEEMGA